MSRVPAHAPWYHARELACTELCRMHDSVAVHCGDACSRQTRGSSHMLPIFFCLLCPALQSRLQCLLASYPRPPAAALQPPPGAKLPTTSTPQHSRQCSHVSSRLHHRRPPCQQPQWQQTTRSSRRTPLAIQHMQQGNCRVLTNERAQARPCQHRQQRGRKPTLQHSCWPPQRQPWQRNWPRLLASSTTATRAISMQRCRCATYPHCAYASTLRI